MTAQIATPTPIPGALTQMLRFANVVTDVADTLGRMGVEPMALSIDRFTMTHGATFGVGVHLPGTVPQVVDDVAAKVPAVWWTDDDGRPGTNYTRVGLVRFGGELVRMRVFTGRPDTTGDVL